MPGQAERLPGDGRLDRRSPEAGWDAICIGAGLNALAFAALYQHRHPGRRVLLIDKHSQPGGYATEFRRPKVAAMFDCSLHKLSGMNAGGNLRRILHGLGLLEGLDLSFQGELFVARTGGGSLAIPSDPDGFRSTLIAAFPREAAGIERFVADLDVHGRFVYFKQQILDGTYVPNDPEARETRQARKMLRSQTVAAAVSQYVGDPGLKEILFAPTLYIGGFAEDMSYLHYLHVLFAYMHQGSAYLVGSSQRLSDLLVRTIRAGGGEVILGKTVRRVLANAQSVATGVQTADGRVYGGRSIVVNASPHFALDHLFQPDHALDAARARLQHLRPSFATTTLYLVLDRPPAALGFPAYETMLFSESNAMCARLRHDARESPADEAVQERAYWTAPPMLVTNYHSVDPHRNHVLVANVLDHAGHWPARDGHAALAAYKRKKRRAVEALVARLHDAAPQLVPHIIHRELATPRTYERFTNNTSGAGYGAAIGPGTPAQPFHHDFPVKGVRFMSAWTATPGYEAAFSYAEAQVEAGAP